MKKYLDILKETKLFSGVDENDIEAMLNCLDAKLEPFKKGDYVLKAGESSGTLSVLVQGKLHIQKDDYWGNRSIANVIECGDMFGESYALPESGVLLNDVVAVEDSSVIFMDINRVLNVCGSACVFHTATVRNLFSAVTEKNRILLGKLGIISKRSTREKLVAYLSEEAKRQNKSAFEIPFNRQQLADFLSVDRSAMSNELSKMRDEGLLEFKRNSFVLHNVENEDI